MRTCVFDTESNGFLNQATVIWCATLYFLEESKTISLGPNEIDQLPSFIRGVDLLIGHNIIKHDLPLIKKLLNYEHKGKIFDTLIGSRVLWPDLKRESWIETRKTGREVVRKARNAHGLENWGLIFGVKKPEHEDWLQFSAEMLYRNQEDVKINVLLYEKIQKEIKNYQLKDKRLNNWDKIWALEHSFAQGMFKQEQNGWYFDVDLAADIEKELSNIVNSIDRKLDPYLPIRVIKPYRDGVCKGLKMDGTPSTNAIKWVGIENENKVGGDFCRFKYEKTSLDSPDQLKEFLLSHGWQPKNYNYKKDEHNKPLKDENKQIIYTSPQTPKTVEEWEEIADKMDNPTIKLLAERGKAAHRLSTVQGYFRRLRPDRRISCAMNTCGTPTFRARHSGIVNVPKAKDHVYYGHQFRQMFTCPKGRILVGCDAKALEARMEAHYVYQFDKKAAEALITGSIHDINATAWDVNRDIAKNGKYCLTYGGGKWKLAETLHKPFEMSEELYEAFWAANPALKKLNDALSRQWQKMGYLVAVDGRPIQIRYAHATLNSLLQSAGAIVMKIAWCFADQAIKREGLDSIDVGNFHDEIDQETKIELVNTISEILEQSIIKAGEYLKLNVPLAGESKAGYSWKEIH
jgi:DNA polymerase-1